MGHKGRFDLRKPQVFHLIQVEIMNPFMWCDCWSDLCLMGPAGVCVTIPAHLIQPPQEIQFEFTSHDVHKLTLPHCMSHLLQLLFWLSFGSVYVVLTLSQANAGF